jgi:hypothetical protein
MRRLRQRALNVAPVILLLGSSWLAPASLAQSTKQRSACFSAGTATNTVIRFYLALDRGQYAAAYGCLSPSLRAAMPYGRWVSGYANTVATHLLIADDKILSNGQPANYVSIELLGADRSSHGLTAITFAGRWYVNHPGLLSSARIHVVSQQRVTSIPALHPTTIFARHDLNVLHHVRVTVTGKGKSDVYITSGAGCASCHAQQIWIYHSGTLIFQQEVDDAQIVPARNYRSMTIATDTPGSTGFDSCCPTEKTITIWDWTIFGFTLRHRHVVLTSFGRHNPSVNDPAVIRAHGYDPVTWTQHTHDGPVHTPDGFGHTLYAWVAICHSSGDGYCQKVFFFIDTRFVGTDTSKPSPQILRLAARGTGVIAVTYAYYRKNDPLCCPTGHPFTITFHWTGQRLRRSRA